jgi:uncharacterized membrane protein SpoIIM required for sporulation
MDYRRFRELRERTWQELEEGLARARRQAPDYPALERLSFLYRQVLHDLSVARVRFPGTAVSRRLQQLTLQATHWLQRDDGESLPTLYRFFFRLFPTAVRQVLPSIGLAGLLFVAGALLGAALTAVEPAIGGIFLPPETVAELRQGKLWTDSIFSVTPGSVASSAIARNNLSVLFTAFAGGALAGIGSIYVVAFNGLMLGAILVLTSHHSMARPLFEFIAAHGPLELSLIVVAAGCGLHLGTALFRDDDRPRGEVLRVAGRQALLVILGASPFIVLLALVEGYISPSNLAFELKVLLGLGLELVFVAWCGWPVPAAEREALRKELST